MGYNTEFNGESPTGGSRSCATALVSRAPRPMKLWYTTAVKLRGKSIDSLKNMHGKPLGFPARIIRFVDMGTTPVVLTSAVWTLGHSGKA